MRIRVLLVLANAALVVGFVAPFARNASLGWSDGHD